MPSTVYDIQVNYGLNDRASSGLSSIGAKADAAAKSTTGLKDVLIGLGGIWAAKTGFALGKELFIDLNSQMQQMKISMAAVMGYNLGRPFDDALVSTNRLIDGWIRFSAQTSLTGTEMVQFGQAVQGAVTSIGGSLSDVDEITKKGSVVYQAVSGGHPGGMQYAQLEMREALMGNLRKTQMANMQLLTPAMERAGLSVDQWNRLTGKDRLMIMKQAINDPSWKSALNEMANSWQGVTTTLKTNIEIAAREIGLPLFKKMSEEVHHWNEWIKDNTVQLKAFATSFSEGLTKGFEVIKSVAAFVVENKDVLLAIGQAWIGGKISSGIMGTAKNIFASFGEAATSASNLGIVLSALSAEAKILQVAFAFMNQEHDKTVKRHSDRDAIVNEFFNNSNQADLKNVAITRAMQMGAIDANINPQVGLTGASLNKGKFLGELSKMGFEDVTQANAIFLTAQRTILENQAEVLGRMFFKKTPLVGDDFFGPWDDSNKTVKVNPTVNVTIHRIEATNSDPDRFVIGLVKKFHDVVKNPVAAESQLRGAF